MIGSFGGEGGCVDCWVVVLPGNGSVPRRTRKMASSVKAKGCKKEELSFSSCNTCNGFSIFRVGTKIRMCCVCLNKGKDHPSTMQNRTVLDSIRKQNI
ncbi:unnamed protein product [Prunus brigantina]